MTMTSFAPLTINEVVIIESLEDDEVKTGQHLADYLNGLQTVQEKGIGIRLQKCNHASECVEQLRMLTAEAAQHGSRPILHFECHGSMQSGLEFANGSDLGWTQLGDELRGLNAATGVNLLVSISACYGAHLLTDMASLKPAPCLMMIGPMQEVTPSDLMAGFRLFYRILFNSGSAGHAIKAVVDQAPGVWDVTHAEYWFDLIITNYVKESCTRQGIKRHAMEMHTRSKQDGAAIAVGRFKRELLRSHSKDLSGEMFDTFFLLDAFPKNRQRFDSARRRLESKLNEFRSTGLYML